MHCTAWDVRKGFEITAKDRPHRADASEISAYMDWQRRKLALPELADVELHFYGAYYGDGHCVGATWGANAGGEYEPGAYSIIMPGHDQHRQCVTLDELDDAGEITRTATLAIEPKRGGVFWTKDQVRAAAGPIAKPAKAKRGAGAPVPLQVQPAPIAEPAEIGEAVDMVAVASVAAPQSDQTLARADTAETPAITEAASRAAPGHVAAAEDMVADPLDAIAGRVAALEARLDALSMQSDAIEEMAPVRPYAGPIAARTVLESYRAKAMRSPAHERAIRRAWAERAARRRAQMLREIASARADRAEAWAQDVMRRRRASAERARRMITAARQATSSAQCGRAAALATLSQLRADMADVAQPERASDIARLVKDRDQARAACTALEQRAQRAEAFITPLANKVEEMAGRLARAEAAMRRAAA